MNTVNTVVVYMLTAGAAWAFWGMVIDFVHLVQGARGKRKLPAIKMIELETDIKKLQLTLAGTRAVEARNHMMCTYNTMMLSVIMDVRHGVYNAKIARDMLDIIDGANDKIEKLFDEMEATTDELKKIELFERQRNVLDQAAENIVKKTKESMKAFHTKMDKLEMQKSQEMVLSGSTGTTLNKKPTLN